jgi:hypothetical protein
MTAAEWYRLLNQHVFFWPNEERLMSLLSARAYRDRDHDVIVVPTEQLLANHREHVFLSPINSGSTIYNPPPRGRGTFRSIEEYPFAERLRLRGLAGAIAEIAVRGGVPDIAKLAERVERRRRGRVLMRIL